jgi:stearoyl-CoA desaturase (delta-9 desaturase)
MEMAIKNENHSNNNYFQNFLMLIIHILAIYSIFWSKVDFPISLVVFAYCLRLFFVAAGNHRYFSHKSFQLNRFFQFWFALGSTLAMHNSIFWWASKHRLHHKYNEKELDPHSHKRGFYWSHIGWVIEDDNIVNEDMIKDLTRYPELVFFHRNHKLINLIFAVLVFGVLGFNWFCSVYCLSLVASWTTMFFINSLGHRFGYRNFKSKDDSTNIIGFSLLSLGEGLHNNHHANPSSPNNRTKWFEIDLVYTILYFLSFFKIVKFRKNNKT